MAIKNWEELAQISQKILADSIPKEWMVQEDKLPPPEQLDVHTFPEECGMLSEKEITITRTDSVGIVEKNAAGEWTAEEVTIAFGKRAVVGHQLTNFATEFLIPDALEQARKLDAHYRTHGTPIGPLHGLPISVKEHLCIANHITHAGYTAGIADPPPITDALLIQYLRAAGAIPFVRTNEPQSLMHLDCRNRITGATTNPFNRRLTPGGSSGGEGAALGLRASPLGIGTDIGGSIRHPAACNGVYGLRPTALRVPGEGIKKAGAGQESVRGVVGPLGQSTRDLTLFMCAVLAQHPWRREPSLIPLPWRPVDFPPPSTLTIGILADDGVVRPHPPIARALRAAVARLRDAPGITLVDWPAYRHDHGVRIVSALYFPDGAAAHRRLLDATGEPPLPLTEWAFAFSASTPLTIGENWKWNVERDEYRAEYVRRMDEMGVDVLLCPAYVGVAPELDTARYWGYTSVWNVLDFPAAVFPTGDVVDVDRDKVEEGEFVPRNEVEGREWEGYSPEKYIGAPLALQLVARRFEDEKLLAAMQVVEDAIKAEA